MSTPRSRPSRHSPCAAEPPSTCSATSRSAGERPPWNYQRALAAVLCLALIPLATTADALASVIAVALVRIGLVAFETVRYREARDESATMTRRARLAVRILAFSDLHRDLGRAARLVEPSADADLVIGAGDFASVHEGLEETIAALAAIRRPTVLVPGNNETEAALREAAAGWYAASVLHGDGTAIGGIDFFGLGAGIPVTPWDWSFDLDEDDAAETLTGCPEGAVLVVHSPPAGHCDVSGAGDHLGSTAIAGAIEAQRPRLAVCGHIHESWGERSRIGETEIANLGPDGAWFEVG